MIRPEYQDRDRKRQRLWRSDGSRAFSRFGSSQFRESGPDTFDLGEPDPNPELADQYIVSFRCSRENSTLTWSAR
jgi:hypothetical protein